MDNWKSDPAKDWTKIILAALVTLQLRGCFSMNAEEKLTNHLLNATTYNKLLCPSETPDSVNVYFDLYISQLIGVNEREQFMVTKVWIPQLWTDKRLSWDPLQYQGLTKIQLPSTKIWSPDIVLYNNADGEYEVSLHSNAIVLSNGSVSWMPPAIYRSACSMKVSDFPFDEQNCTMTFRSWTYTREDIELHLINDKAKLDDFTPSGEWDILDTPGIKNTYEENEGYQEITYSLIIKRKPLFYTVNLIIPCILITFLAILVFYTPSDCGEKMTLCISVLLALTVFLLLLSKMVPPTSLDVPMIGKYLMFTMVLVTLSVVTSVCVLNLHHRQASTHTMPRWVKICFLDFLPHLLLIARPESDEDVSRDPQSRGCLGAWFSLLHREIFETNKCTSISKNTLDFSAKKKALPQKNSGRKRRYFVDGENGETEEGEKYGIKLRDVSGSSHMRGVRENEMKRTKFSSELKSTINEVAFISDHVRMRVEEQKVSQDWKYVALVVDRLLLIIFVFVFFAGTIGIFF